MSIEFEFDPGRSMLIRTATGDMTFDQLFDIQKVYFEKYRPRNVLLDLSLASVKKLETRDVEALANMSHKKKRLRPTNSKTAIVATSPLAFGLSRMYAIFSEVKDLPWELEVFSSMEAALDWIGPGDRE